MVSQKILDITTVNTDNKSILESEWSRDTDIHIDSHDIHKDVHIEISYFKLQ